MYCLKLNVGLQHAKQVTSPLSYFFNLKYTIVFLRYYIINSILDFTAIILW